MVNQLRTFSGGNCSPDNELQRLIRIALRENKDLKQAVGRIEEFRARAYVARTDFIPQLSATINDPWVQRAGGSHTGVPYAVYPHAPRVNGLGNRHLGTDSPVQ